MPVLIRYELNGRIEDKGRTPVLMRWSLPRLEEVPGRQESINV